MTSRSTRAAWHAGVATLLAAAFVLTACGSDVYSDAAMDDTGAATDHTGATTDDAGTASVDRTDANTNTNVSTDAPAEPGVVEVKLVDFGFAGLPDSIAAGTRLTITNAAPVEIHKLSALRLRDDEDRPVEKLLALPDAELAAILRVRPATVLVAAPGGPQVNEVGDGTLNTPGRYLIICAIPLGLPADEYLNALPSNGRRPQLTSGGRPHFHLGMVDDVVVK